MGWLGKTIIDRLNQKQIDDLQTACDNYPSAYTILRDKGCSRLYAFKYWFFEESKLWNNKLFDSIRYKYYDIIPYDWRPLQIWYRLKCFVWKRYSTVKPRYLPHTWVDRCTLLPHMMFEILTQFYEEEVVDSIVNWYSEECKHKIIPGQQWDGAKANDPQAVWVADEIKYLVDWWKKFQTREDSYMDEYCEYRDKNDKGFDDDWEKLEDGRYVLKESTEIEREILERSWKMKADLKQELHDHLIRVINIKDFLWT